MKKRVISIIRNIFDGVMIFVLFITTTVYALPSNGVIYDNSNSGSSATNVSEAIDDLYSKLTTKEAEINRLKGLGNVASNQMLKGYTALVKGNLVTGTIPSKGATTYTPGKTNQTIASGNYLSGTQTIKGDANLVAGNIAKGKSIFGITGSYTSDANAAAGNILSGKTAYVNGAKISGTMIDRGLAQSGNWGCGSSGCGTGNDAYYAINGLPEGWYHSDGNSWAPEARINANTLRSQLGVSANKIAKGQSIAGIAGTYTSDANATAADIAVGKTAYVNGNKITGTASKLSVGDVMNVVRGSGKTKAQLVVPNGVTEGFVIVNAITTMNTNVNSKISGNGVISQFENNMGTISRGDQHAYSNTKIYKVSLTPGGTITANVLNYYSTAYVGISLMLLA